MSTINAEGFSQSGPLQFDSGPIVVNDSNNWIQVAIIQLNGVKDEGLLTLIVGAGGALAHLKLTRADKVGGLHVDFMVDTDFNVATDEMLDCIVPGSGPPPAINQLAAGGIGQIRLSKMLPVGELGIWAKKSTSDTTLQVTGCFSSH